MFKHGKTALILAITLSVLGTASTAFAGGKDDDGAGHDRWEGKIGPSGQVFGQSGWIGQPSNAFAQSPAHTHLDRVHRKISGRTRLILIQRSYYEGSSRSQSPTGPSNPSIGDDFEGYPHPK